MLRRKYTISSATRQRYPAIAPALSLAGGAALGSGLDMNAGFLLGVLASVLFASVACFLMRCRQLSLICTLLLIAATAALRSVDPVESKAMSWSESQSVTVAGYLFREPSGSIYTTRWYVRGVATSSPDIATRRTVLVIPGEHPGATRGDLVACTGTPHVPETARNPGSFDYREYLSTLDIFWEIHCRPESLRLLSRRTPYQSSIVSIRHAVDSALGKSVPDQRSVALLRALIIGDRSSIERSVRRDFHETGLMHVLAVSGLHVMLIVLSFHSVIRPMLVRLRLTWFRTECTRLILSALVLGMYCLVSGASESVVRASVMCLIFIASPVFRRSASTMNSLAAAALVILAFDPSAVQSIGFQLSFAAVLSIITITPNLLPESISRTLSMFLQPFVVTVAATAGTAPILLAHFGSFSLGGFILNPIAIPLTACTLSSGVLAVCAELIGSGRLFGVAADIFASLLMDVTSLVNEKLQAEIFASSLDLPRWIGIFLIAIVPAVWNLKTLRGSVLSVALGVMAVVQIGRLVVIDDAPDLDVVFVDVGQGDAAIVRSPCGETVLLDAGPGSIESEWGALAIYDVLRSLGVRGIDLVVVSHPHADHLGGLVHLAGMIPVRSVIQQTSDYESELVKDIAFILDRHKIPSAGPEQLQTVKMDCLQLTFFGYPYRDNANNSSIVVRLDYGSTSFLFTGDIEERAEQYLVSHMGELLAADVIKVAHHGSRTSSSQEFVEFATSRPGLETAIVSAGRRNRFSHPHAEALARWKNKASVFVTADRGAIWIKSDGHQISTFDWRQSGFD